MNIVVAHNLKVLVISGSMGSGKTTVLGEASDLLGAAEIIHAAIDLDSLALGHLPAGETRATSTDHPRGRDRSVQVASHFRYDAATNSVA